MTEWFESFFDELAHDVWRALVPDDHSDAEAQFVADALVTRSGPGAELLDAPSGDGRLALRVAAMGHKVTGVDLSSVAVDRLRDQGRAQCVTVNAVLADLRQLGDVTPAAAFDGAFCMGNSFGYLDDEGTAAFVSGVARALRPGARFVIDHPLAAECVLPSYADGDDVHRVGDVALSLASEYEPITSTMVGTMTLERGGEIAHRVVRHRVTTCAQVVAVLEKSGFTIVDLFGGVDRQPFSVGSPTLIVVAERR